ncbi:hypothetical protein BDZ97DRAFT_2079378 [Flammula alnicola]|nr:hypothetical protein BDZ97DRAFT_2079378 [Flammula alnicola]
MNGRATGQQVHRRTAQPTKHDLISSILKDSRCCTQPASICLEFQKMLDERREGKKTSSENIT